MKCLFLLIPVIILSCKQAEKKKTMNKTGVIEAFTPKKQITFPHKIHSDNKIDCKYCHNPKTQSNKVILTETICENCHQKVKSEGNKKPKESSTLKKYFYPNMSFCGGALYGFYRDDELMRIESTFGSESGYSSKNVDFNDGKIIRIRYREHYVDWEKFNKNYTNEGEIDSNKLNFTDTLYVLEFGQRASFKTYVKNKLISTKLNTVLKAQLISCVETMKKELASKKELVNE
ncbi:MAG: hypothetical protein RI922_1936 [Bacteroidota bacterium]|jgi:hypothetical protein